MTPRPIDLKKSIIKNENNDSDKLNSPKQENTN